MSKNSKAFIISILIGLICWAIIYIFLPVTPQIKVSPTTILFVALNYIALVLGFYLFRFKGLSPAKSTLNYQKVLTLLISLVFISFLFRYYDLFQIRGLSFKNEIWENRQLSVANYKKSTLLFSFFSGLTSLYFFPFIICLITKNKRKLILVFSIILLLLALPEAILKGSRMPFLEIALILIISSFYFKIKGLKKVRIPLIIGLLLTLFFVSEKILFSRSWVTDNNKLLNQVLTTARYNDFLKPNEKVVSYIKDSTKSNTIKQALFTSVHFGQYYTHGLFELQYLMDNKTMITYGRYSFAIFPKLTNKIGLTNIDLTELAKASPRKFVYLTGFGSLYLDFRWFSILFMFLLGTIQKCVSNRAEKSAIWMPIFVYFLIINVFLSVLNYMKGAGIYPIIGFLFLLLIIKILGNRLNEKSIGT